MRRDQWQIRSSQFGGEATVVAYGHYGKPFIVFPSEQGSPWDFENNGMIGAVVDLIEAGRVKLYAVSSHDGASWSDSSIDLESRAKIHLDYESWILDDVVPAIWNDCDGLVDIGLTGASMGAFHALNFALRHAEKFDAALCMSGNYDSSSWHGWGRRDMEAYFTNPHDYVPHLGGAHLDWLRSRLRLVLVAGQGQWEDTTGALDSTRFIGGLLRDRDMHCEVDLWGYDVPHDWPSWRRQLAHHLPRLI